LLFFIAIVLLWRVVETWSRTTPPLVPDPQPQPQNEAVPRPTPVPTLTIGKQVAQVITEKDLFSPSRKQTVQEAAPAPAPVAPPAHLKLVGVILFPDHEEAFFADSSQGGKVVRMRKGESLGSYRLMQVMPLQATLSLGQDGEEVSLPLVVIDSNIAAKAPRLIPPVAQSAPSQAGNRRARAVAPGSANELSDETQAIRQNIQQLQRRLRQIRRQAARQEAENPEEEPPPAEEETEGEESEE
jgi:type II secretory pathway component PulC